MRGYFRNKKLSNDKSLRAYIVGLAIGDGNLSNPNNRATRLRITCDKKYPRLLKRIIDALQLLLPENKVSLVKRKGCIDVSVYSNHLEKTLGWKAKMGSKFNQNVSVPPWIKRKNNYKINCLKGLMETDGSIYSDRGYPAVMFVTVIQKLAKEVHKMMTSLGFKPRLYKIERKNNPYNFKQRAVYHIRLSKNVSKFLTLVSPNKC